MPNTNVPLGQFFTIGEQIELREALRSRLRKQIDWTINSEFAMGFVHKAARQSVRDVHSALQKVLEYRDDDEGVDFKDPETLADLDSILNEDRSEEEAA